MRALAWDDKPQYFKSLAERLKEENIELIVTQEQAEFKRLFKKEKWDFYITDLIDNKGYSGKREEQAGKKIITYIREQQIHQHWRQRGKPIFLITEEPDLIDPGYASLNNVILKSKTLGPSHMAFELTQELKNQGLMVKPNKIFIIYGHNQEMLIKLTKEFEVHDLEVITMASNNSFEIAIQNIKRAMVSAAAIIAICSSDDIIYNRNNETIKQPRPNVLVEIGMVMGQNNGPQRLIMLKEKGVTLPSDIGQYVSLQYDMQNTAGSMEDLLKRMRLLGVDV